MRKGRSITGAVAMAIGTVPALALGMPGGEAAGQEGSATPGDLALQAMRERNARIQQANYPREALRRGEQGVVGISVTTDRQGRMRECAVSRSSGSAALDAATCDFLFEHGQIQAYVAPSGGGQVRRQEGQVVWQLPAGYKPAVVASATPSASTPPASARKICRVQTKTGSLVASQRICLTKAEWQRQYDYAQDETRDMHPRSLPGE